MLARPSAVPPAAEVSGSFTARPCNLANDGHSALAAFRLLAEQSAFLQTHLDTVDFGADAAVAILALCKRTISFPLFEKTCQWDANMRVLIHRP